MKYLILLTITLSFFPAYASKPQKREFVPIKPINIKWDNPKKEKVWYGPDGEVLPDKEPNKNSEPDGSLFPKVKLDFD